MGETNKGNLQWAIQNGEVNEVKEIVEQNKGEDIVNKLFGNGRPPLCMAADYGHVDICQYLVENGAQINATDKHGITPLLSAVYENHANCVRYLLSKNADRTLKSPDGRSYIECAETDDIKLLLK